MNSHILQHFSDRLLRICLPIFGTSRRNNSSRRGFTLVETVLALGVVAFSMTGILGMLVVGLTNFRDAVNCTVESQIVQNVSNDIMLTDYAFLVGKQYPYSKYYDEQGNEVTENSAARYFVTEVDKAAVTAPSVDTAAATTFILRMRNPKQTTPNLYTIIVSKG